MRLNRLALLPAALLAAALAAPAAAETKIAVISTQVLLREAPQIKSADAKLKAEFSRREQDLQTEGRKLEDDIAKFRREADTMSPQQRTNSQNDLNTRRTNVEVKQRQFQEQAQTRNAELQREVLEKISQAIEAVAREKALDIVVRDPAYAATGLDITADVLKKLATYPETTAAPADPKKKKK